MLLSVQECFSFYCRVVLQCEDALVFLYFHLPVGIQGVSRLGLIMNKAAINILEQVFLWTYVFILLINTYEWDCWVVC